jgi:2-beta-glucuronyltransferase
VYPSKRRAGFHFIADALQAAGWEVTFFTAALSRLSRLRKDHRLSFLEEHPPNRLERIREGLQSYIAYTSWHPANLRSSLLNALSRPIFSRYGELWLGPMEDVVRGAELVIFESSPGLLLFERFRRLSSRGRFVYRISDDLRFLRNHPLVIEAEERLAPRFDLVSAPCDYIFRRFAHLPNARLQHHGIRKDLFDRPCERPYQEGGPANVVFTGNAWFDVDFLARAVRLLPDWRFHIFGRIDDLPAASNIVSYGECPFAETIPYIRHADVGLQNLIYRPGAEAFTDSLKVLQYTYCRLPIVMPEFLRSARSNVFYYRPGDDESIRTALVEARKIDRSMIATDGIHTWDELAAMLLEGGRSPSV